jgi:ankyrin repeat protein
VHNHVIADTMAKMLVRHGADINWCDVTGRTALHCAIEVACFKESSMSALQHIDFLLQIEANVNTVSRDRESPLYAACVMGHTEVMSRLLLHGARVADGRLLLAACDREHFPAVTLLLSYGADPNASVQSEEIVPQNYGDSTNAESGSKVHYR